MTNDKLSGVRHRSVRFSPSGGKGDKRERLPIPGKSLSLVISFFGHLSLVTRLFSLTIKGKVSFEGSVVIRFVKA